MRRHLRAAASAFSSSSASPIVCARKGTGAAPLRSRDLPSSMVVPSSLPVEIFSEDCAISFQQPTMNATICSVKGLSSEPTLRLYRLQPCQWMTVTGKGGSEGEAGDAGERRPTPSAAFRGAPASSAEWARWCEEDRRRCEDYWAKFQGRGARPAAATASSRSATDSGPAHGATPAGSGASAEAATAPTASGTKQPTQPGLIKMEDQQEVIAGIDAMCKIAMQLLSTRRPQSTQLRIMAAPASNEDGDVPNQDSQQDEASVPGGQEPGV